MKTRLLRLFTIVLVIGLLFSGGQQRAIAQNNPPTTPPVPAAAPAANHPIQPPSSPWQDKKGNGPMPADQAAQTQLAGQAPQSTGGPDDFGYTWNDSVAFKWIDATSGADSGLAGDDEYSPAINIGFPFKFYQNTYTQLYFSTNGLVTFGSGSSAYANSFIPNPAAPNNYIAPYWDDLTVGQTYNPGKIYYLSGGSAPNRYFVVEWQKVTACCDINATDYKTFEAVIYENGDIVTQYLTLSGSLNLSTVGLEDADGISGLQYLFNAAGLSNNKAIYFTHPAPIARVQIYPSYQGNFTHPGGTVAFQITLHNTGELGSDTYALTPSSTWPIQLYAADGTTPLTDTDGDHIIDTGPVSQGAAFSLVAKIQAPSNAAVGDATLATVVAQSTLSPSRTKTVTLQAAIPAPFAQVYEDNADGAMSLYLAQPDGQTVKQTTNANWFGYNMATTETPGGNFAYVWNKARCLDSNCVQATQEVEYTLLNKYGDTLRGVSKLVDNSGATFATYDYAPAVAATPDGHIGIVWYRELIQTTNNISQYNFNIYFAVLDSSGSMTYGPVNLTNNTGWGDINSPASPQFIDPHITATSDNRFVLAWEREQGSGSNCTLVDCSLVDIYYAVQSTGGSAVKAITQFTFDTTGSTWEAYDYPNLAALSGNRAMLTWRRQSNGASYFAVLDSAGNVFKDKTILSADHPGWGADAVQLSDGNIVVGYTGSTGLNTIYFTVLDTNYNRTVGPVQLSHPAALGGNAFVSVTADNAGRAILTWMDYDGFWPNLYYALVNSSGAILTQPMIFRSSQAAPPFIVTGYAGYGNTSYSSITSGVDNAIWTGSSLSTATPGKGAPISVNYTNRGQVTATGVVVTATLGAGLTYRGDTSGVTPTVAGSLVTWNLPDTYFLEAHQFMLYVGVPAGATIGAQYPVTLTIAATQTDANPADNTANVNVMAALQAYLPLVQK